MFEALFEGFTWNFQTILGELLGIVAFVITYFVYQAKTPGRTQLLLTASTVFIVASYVLLGAMSGWILNVICIVRNMCYYFHDRPILRWRGVPYVLAASILVVGMTTTFPREGPNALLMILPLTVNTVMLSLGNNHYLRISILFTSTSVLIYNIFVLSAGGALNEIVAIVSSAIGIVRYSPDAQKAAESAKQEQSVNKA